MPNRLLHDFAASADANVSFDAKTVLFAGKKSGRRSVADMGTHAGRSQRSPGDFGRRRMRCGPSICPAGAGFCAAGTAGISAAWPRTSTARTSCRSPTCPPARCPTDVLADGRILFEAGFPLGSGNTPELFLVYSDGSGVESYRCDHGAPRWGGHQLASGDVVFTHGASLARFTSPLAHEERVAAPRADYCGWHRGDAFGRVAGERARFGGDSRVWS